jgi:hypothetical protein
VKTEAPGEFRYEEVLQVETITVKPDGRGSKRRINGELVPECLSGVGM